MTLEPLRPDCFRAPAAYWPAPAPLREWHECGHHDERWPCPALHQAAMQRALARMKAAAVQQREVAELLCEAINSVSELGPREFILRLQTPSSALADERTRADELETRSFKDLADWGRQERHLYERAEAAENQARERGETVARLREALKDLATFVREFSEEPDDLLTLEHAEKVLAEAEATASPEPES